MKIKAMPRKGESQADAIKRVQAEHPNDEIVPASDPPRRGKRSSKGRTGPSQVYASDTNAPTSSSAGGLLGKGGLSVNLLTTLGRTLVPASPPPELYRMATGRVAGTEVIQDRMFTEKVHLIFPLTFPVGATQATFFQTSSTNADAVVNSLLGGTLRNLYSMIVRELMSTTGRVMRDTVLLNTGTNDSFTNWITQYATAFLILRGMQSVIESGNINLGLSVLAAAFNQQLFRLEADLRRLFTYSVPPEFIVYLDRLCGVKILDMNGVAFVPGIGASTPLLDLTSVANVITLLGIAETALNALSVGGATVPTSDLNAISNTFAIAYGTPQMPQEKGPSTDPLEYAMQVTQAFTQDNSTSALNFTWPNINATGAANGMVPMLVPKGASGPGLDQYFSLLRTPVYSVDPVAGQSNANVASQVGFISNNTVSIDGTTYGTYNQATAFSGFLSTLAGSSTTNFTLANLELFVWSSEATNTVGQTNYSTDRRAFRDFDRVYVAKDWLIEETQYLLEKIWLDPIRGKTIPAAR